MEVDQGNLKFVQNNYVNMTIVSGNSSNVVVGPGDETGNGFVQNNNVLLESEGSRNSG